VIPLAFNLKIKGLFAASTFAVRCWLAWISIIDFPSVLFCLPNIISPSSSVQKVPSGAYIRFEYLPWAIGLSWVRAVNTPWLAAWATPCLADHKFLATFILVEVKNCFMPL